MRIVVLGAGAMGGLYGSYLSRGNDVTMVDINADVVDKINREGFEVREPDGSSNVFHPKAVTATAGMDWTSDSILIKLVISRRSPISRRARSRSPPTYGFRAASS